MDQSDTFHVWRVNILLMHAKCFGAARAKSSSIVVPAQFGKNCALN